MPNIPIALVPQSGQTLADTRDPIRNNFNTINLDFKVDHVEYGILNEGKHNQVTFPNHAGAVPHVAGEIVLFNKTTALTGVPDIWMERGSVALSSSNPIPITGKLAAANGWTYLPSGILLKWGQTTGGFLVGNDWTFVTYPVAANIPVFTTVFSIQVSPKVVTPQPSVAQTTALLDLNTAFPINGFYVFNRRTDIGPGINADCTYFAIGV